MMTFCLRKAERTLGLQNANKRGSVLCFVPSSGVKGDRGRKGYARQEEKGREASGILKVTGTRRKGENFRNIA